MELPLAYLDYLRRYAPMQRMFMDRLISERNGGSRSTDWDLFTEAFPASSTSLIAATLLQATGKAAYALTPQLQEEFASAELPSGLDIKDLRLPAPAIWVGFPQCKYEIFGGATTGWLRVNGAIVFDVSELGRVYATTPEDAGIGVCLWAQPRSLDKDPNDDALFTAGVSLSDIKDLEGALRERTNTQRRSDINPRTGLVLHLERTAHDVDKENANIVPLLRFVLNLLLHLNMPRPVLTRRPDTAAQERDALLTQAQKLGERKKERLLRRVGNMSQHTYLILDAPRYVGGAPADGSSGGARRGHWRQGHYRRVWFGARTDADGNPRPGERYEWTYFQRQWVEGTETSDPMGFFAEPKTKIVTRRRSAS